MPVYMYIYAVKYTYSNAAKRHAALTYLKNRLGIQETIGPSLPTCTKRWHVGVSLNEIAKTEA